MKITALLAPLRRAAAWCRDALSTLRAWVLLFLGLIVLIVLYYVLSDRYAPFTTDAYVQTYVIQVAAQVEGKVVRVAVRENDHVERGQLLFEIDPRPFQHRVRELEARLIYARQQIAQMESDLQAAQAEATQAEAEHTYARQVYDQENEIYKQESTTTRRFLDAVKGQNATRASLDRAQAVIKQKEQALAAKLGQEHSLVAEVQARLETALLDLEWTRVHAPVAGVITNLQLAEGSYVHVGQPVLTCIDSERRWIVGNFRENALEGIVPGQSVDLSFNNYPGRIFPGRVETVGWGVDQGQGVPSGRLPEVKTLQPWLKPAQRFQVRIVPDESVTLPLRVGATANVTVYTREDFWLNPLADAWHHIVAWFDYLY